MNSQIESEIKYLTTRLHQVSYNNERFKLYIEGNKFICGIITPSNATSLESKILEYNTLYNTLKDLDWKIKTSFEESIKYTYTESVLNHFKMIGKPSEDENLAYYYIENALFRTITLWDILAQLYRIHYQINISIYKVGYKKIFNPNSPNSDSFKAKATEINNYINEKDDEHDQNGEWKGNHDAVNMYRNKMTHRNAPSIASMSNFDFNLKTHPTVILKQGIEDYYVVSKYIQEILDIIEKDCIEKFNKQ